LAVTCNPQCVLLSKGLKRHDCTVSKQADKFAVDLNYAKELRGGLIRLQEENKSSTNIDPWYSAYHHTHPPLVERLKALNLKKKE